MMKETVFGQFPLLHSERLTFRPFCPEDAAGIFAIRTHPLVMKYLDSDPHSSPEVSAAFVQNNIDAFKNYSGIAWVITDKSTGAFMGDFSFWRLDKKNNRAEIGYTLLPEYWGKGFMQESMRCLLEFGFDQMQLHSIEANINPQNENSRKILLKMGFRKEAYFRENYYYNGKYLDSEIYSLLRKWWAERDH